MKLHEYNEMMSYVLRRPMSNGGRIGNVDLSRGTPSIVDNKDFQNKVKEFYLENIDKINNIRNNEQYQGLALPSTGQTIMNFLLVKHNVEKNLLPEIYNLGDLHRKNLLHMPGQSWWPDVLTYLDAAWIYHFSAIPGKGQQPRHVEYWMERTYNELYG